MTNSYSSQHSGNEILLKHLILEHVCPKNIFFPFNSKYKGGGGEVLIYFQLAKQGFFSCVTFTTPLTLMQASYKVSCCLE